MKRLLLLALLSVPCFAQTDIAVDVRAEERTSRAVSTFYVHVEWRGALSAQGVVLEIEPPPGQIIGDNLTYPCERGATIRCPLPDAYSYSFAYYVSMRFPSPGAYTARARVTSRTPDPNPANNSDEHTVVTTAQPSMRPYAIVDLGGEAAVDPGGAGNLRVGIQNDGDTARNVVLRVVFPEGGTFTEPDAWAKRNCTVVSGGEAVCRFDEIETFRPFQLTLPFIAPDRAGGGTFPFRITVESDRSDENPADDAQSGEIPLRRLFAVTTPADEGAGSLRQALLDTRAFCENAPCLVAVRMNGQAVILPRTPLPEMRGRIKIDGGAPKAILDGALLEKGHALVFEDGCEFRVKNLIIRGFNGHAVEARLRQAAPRCGPASMLTPLWVTDSELIDNVRGVVTIGTSATITGNVIRDHRRAGIFVDGSYFTDISRNVIVANGASGVYLNASPAQTSLPPGAEIVENFISGNAEWGVARTPHGSVHVARNAIFANGYYGIDWGLDLDTPRAPNEPVLFSAAYDPARDATIIRGQVTFVSSYGSRIDLYASTSLSRAGHPEAEQWLREVHVGNGAFEAVVPGDLRGKWITATGTRITDLYFLRGEGSEPSDATWRSAAYDTSELSDPIQVQ